MNDILSDTNIEGVMGKLGGFFGNSIQDRYFVLKGHLLAYYANEEESKKNKGENAKGALECRAVDTINHDSPRYTGQNKDNLNLRFTLRGPLLKREYILEAKTAADRTKWIDAIRYARIRHDISRSELNLVNIIDNSAVFFADSTKLAKLQLMDSAISLVSFTEAMKSGKKEEVVACAKQAAQAAYKAVGGKDPNDLRVVDANGNSILHIVCANNRYPLELVRELVDLGAMLHARDFHGRTLLHIALMNGRDPEFIEGLVKLGMSPLVTDSANMNAFHLLAKQSHTALVEPVLRLLVQVTNVGIVPARAAATGKPAEEFADFINTVGGYRAHDRGTVLYFAAANRYMTEKELGLFMTYGADPTWTRQNDEVVQHEAEKMTQEEFQDDLMLNSSVLSERPDMKVILEKCLAANHTPGSMWYNRIVEHAASGTGGDQKVLDSIELVLDSKRSKNVEIEDNNKREDLSKLASCCNFETLKTALLRDSLVIFDRLVELGADPAKTNRAGDSLQHVACINLSQRAVDRLIELGISLDSGKKEVSTAIRSRSVLNSSNLGKLDLIYPIDMVFQSQTAFAKDPSGIWPFLDHLLLCGSPATPITLSHAITTKRHDIEVFSKLSSRVLEFSKKKRLSQIAPLIMYSLVFNGGVERQSQDSHLREKFGPMIDTIVDVCADLCKKGAKLDGIDEAGDSRLHGIIIRSARIKPHNVAGIVGLFIETAGPELLFMKDAKEKTVLDLVKERTGRLDMVMRVINKIVPADVLEELQRKSDNGEEIKPAPVADEYDDEGNDNDEDDNNNNDKNKKTEEDHSQEKQKEAIGDIDDERVPTSPNFNKTAAPAKEEPKKVEEKKQQQEEPVVEEKKVEEEKKEEEKSVEGPKEEEKKEDEEKEKENVDEENPEEEKKNETVEEKKEEEKAVGEKVEEKVDEEKKEEDAKQEEPSTEEAQKKQKEQAADVEHDSPRAPAKASGDDDKTALEDECD